MFEDLSLTSLDRILSIQSFESKLFESWYGTFSPPLPGCKIPPNSKPHFTNYSFDMAQQVFYPNDPLQPGPVYFLTPRKCAIFVVCCEAIPRHINYLIDEAFDMGKGANAIVSMLHILQCTILVG